MSVQCMACDNLLLLLGSFHDACLKLKQAEDTSNIESSQEDDIGIRRGRRVQKKKDVVIESRDSSSDSELDLDNSLFLAPPTTQISEDQFDITIGKLTGLTSIFIFLNIYIFNLFCCQESTGDQPHPPDENNQQVAVVPEIPQPVIVQEDFDVEQDPKLFLATAADTADIKSLIEGFMKKSFELLERQAEDIREIKAAIHTLRANSQGGNLLPDYSIIPPLPIAGRLELVAFEDWLKSSDSHKKLLISYLSTTGGSNTDRNTRQVLLKLIGGSLRCQINYTGKGNKVALENLEILKILKDSVRTRYPVANDDEILGTAKNWFKYAPKDREDQ
ncbi:uncharacterized protein LOC118439406 isoform X1 [Folsomia candida]|uniref:uncharacterized protein LOC118439406 isoform X1 n=1 Tax=Folsomia candida TaxID=158441 RepID=UPI001604C733|nr:uncharacterized protein LOC118439406 isoform X1 [Folsomia candida]